MMESRSTTSARVLLVVALSGATTLAVAQESAWSLSLRAGMMDAGGEFTATRDNGKTVASDIDGGFYVSVGVERRLGPRWGVSFGYEGSPSRTFGIEQDFPDGTDFSSSDSFSYHALTGGVVYRLLTRSSFDLLVEPYLAWGWFDDVSLAGAGPPFDRTEPLAVDVSSGLGAGAALSARARLGDGGFSLGARGGLTIQRFQGIFPDDPSIPGSGGDIDVAFNPVYLTVELAFFF